MVREEEPCRGRYPASLCSRLLSSSCQNHAARYGQRGWIPRCHDCGCYLLNDGHKIKRQKSKRRAGGVIVGWY
jgi:hypothetical protein